MKNKAILVTIFQFFISITLLAQTTYTYTGDGNWDDITKWENNIYPGTTIDNDETVKIEGSIIIPENLTITINEGGELKIDELNDSRSTNEIKGFLIIQNGATVNIAFCNFLISGSIINKGTTFITDAIVTVDGLVENYSKINTSFNTEITVNGALKTFESSIVDYDISNGGNKLIVNAPFINNGALYMQNIENNSTFTNNKITGREFSIRGTLTISNPINSKFINNNLLHGTIINEGEFSNNVSGTIENYIENDDPNFALNENITNSGIFINNGNLITPPNSPNSFQNTGTLIGNNLSHLNDLTNSTGTLDPSENTENVGVYKIDGDWNQTNEEGKLIIDIVSKTEKDQVFVSKNVTLTGILEVKSQTTLENVIIGEEYTIISAEKITGIFSQTVFPNFTDKSLEVVYYEDRVTLKVVEKTTLNTSEFNLNKKDVFAFPNPAQSSINLNGIKKNTSILIYNMLGQQIRNTTISNTQEIDVATLPKGNYILKVNAKSILFTKL